MEVQAIILFQQEKVNQVENLREALVKLKQRNRTRERFESASQEINRWNNEFFIYR